MTAPLEILFEDDSLLAVAKPSGLPVHGSGDGTPTVESVLRLQLGGRAVRMGFSLTAVHRLDRETSGVLLLARRKNACRRVMQQFEAGTVRKTYLALVLRGPAETSGVIDQPLKGLGRHAGTVQEARTAFEVVARGAEVALVRCRPQTGRTHQIRRHMAHLGAPLVGDERYGSARFNDHARQSWGVDRLCLHAAALALTHPDTDAPLRIERALPDDMFAWSAAAGISDCGLP